MDRPLLSIACITYNHADCIRKCLDGFVRQQTSFSFEIVIHDDASTDNTQSIIREYMDKYPGLNWKSILQTSNKYIEGKGILVPHVFPKCSGKYIAICEGDDYWTDPLKLQKQVDYLEGHPDCTLCGTDAEIHQGDEILDWRRFGSDTDIPMETLITSGGALIQTATYVYRRELMDNYPDFCRQCYVGDYPLILWAAANGKVHYIDEKMAAYRYAAAGSWTARQKLMPVEKRMKNCRSMVNLLQGMNEFTGHKYEQSFRWRMSYIVFALMRQYKRDTALISKEFSEVTPFFSRVQKIDAFLFCTHLDFIHSLLSKCKFQKQ